MNGYIGDINITNIIRPRKGRVAIAYIAYRDFMLGPIYICKQREESFFLQYPKSRSGNGFVFYPINHSFAKNVEEAVLAKYGEMLQEFENMRS